MGKTKSKVQVETWITCMGALVAYNLHAPDHDSLLTRIESVGLLKIIVTIDTYVLLH